MISDNLINYIVNSNELDVLPKILFEPCTSDIETVHDILYELKKPDDGAKLSDRLDIGIVSSIDDQLTHATYNDDTSDVFIYLSTLSLVYDPLIKYNINTNLIDTNLHTSSCVNPCTHNDLVYDKDKINVDTNQYRNWHTSTIINDTVGLRSNADFGKKVTINIPDVGSNATFTMSNAAVYTGPSSTFTIPTTTNAAALYTRYADLIGSNLIKKMTIAGVNVEPNTTTESNESDSSDDELDTDDEPEKKYKQSAASTTYDRSIDRLTNKLTDIFAQTPPGTVIDLVCYYDGDHYFISSGDKIYCKITLRELYHELCSLSNKFHEYLVDMIESDDKIHTDYAMTTLTNKSYPSHNDFSTLFNNTLMSDLSIQSSDGKIIPAHKIILCLNSEYFRTMLSGTWTRDSNVINLDFNSKYLLPIIEFIYTGQFDVSLMTSYKHTYEIVDFLQIDCLLEYLQI